MTSCPLVSDQRVIVNPLCKIFSVYLPIFRFVPYEVRQVRSLFGLRSCGITDAPSPVLKFRVGNADIQGNGHKISLRYVTKNLLQLGSSGANGIAIKALISFN